MNLIRKAKAKDSKEISSMMDSVICSLSLKNYTKKQISAMKKYISEKNILKYIKKFDVFIALKGKHIIGTGSLQKNIIFSIYVKNSNNFIKDPTGGRIIKHIENYAKKSGVRKISLISMPTTKDFFIKKGYKISKKLLLRFEGVMFPEFRLAKKL